MLFDVECYKIVYTSQTHFFVLEIDCIIDETLYGCLLLQVKFFISLQVVGNSSYNPKLIPSCYISKFKDCLLGYVVSLGIKYIDSGKRQQILKVLQVCN